MTVRIGVVVFPGSNCDSTPSTPCDGSRAPSRSSLWHEQATSRASPGSSCPGGFAYGDYLRAGVIARFSPVMRAVAAFAADGGLVLGICNGFQVLAEAGLVPGALLRNRGLRFLGRDVHIAVEHVDTPFTQRSPAPRRPLRMPIAHGEGCYFADEATLDAARARRPGPVPLRRAPTAPVAGERTIAANPNGSLRAIAGVRNAAGNVAGLMPHPERRVRGASSVPTTASAIIRSLVESAAACRRHGRSRRTVLVR